MTTKSNAFRKAVTLVKPATHQEKSEVKSALNEAIAKKSNEQYLGFVRSINRASDTDIDRALAR